MKKLIACLRLLRIGQWVKNTFILIPIIFSGKLFDLPLLFTCAKIFGIFCIMSSGVYVMNDIRDIKSDQEHPKKKYRPVASGEIGRNPATAIAFLLISLALVFSYFSGVKILVITSAYFILHVLYNIRLKRTVILDVIAIAIGFELRVWAGALGCLVIPSAWLQLCVFLLALFLSFIKRRHEGSSLYDKHIYRREALAYYQPYFLDQMIMISATLVIVFYGLYVMSEEITARIGNHHMMYTLPFVVYGIFRYLYLVDVKKMGGDPGEILISDLPFLLNLCLWILSVVAILYFMAR
jgi:4-hydroxybenzoate polyprenyltransferase